MKLQLVCHGMMAIYYRKPKEREMLNHGYTIFIPHPPRGSGRHELRMGFGAGAPDSKLSFTSDFPAVKFYQLQFGPVDTIEARGPKPQGDAIVLYNSLTNLRSKPDLSSVAFAIDIPYPNTEEPVRVVDYPEFPYEQAGEEGDIKEGNLAVTAFGLRGTRLLAARVFTYNLPDGPRNVSLQGRNIVDHAPNFDIKDFGRISGNIRLHLYNQTPERMEPDRENVHVNKLNQMIQFRHGGQDIPLDLKPRLFSRSDVRSDPEDVPVPSGLSFKDTLHLFELYERYELHAQRSQFAPLRALAKPPFFEFDPADCPQPDGCCPEGGC